MSKNFITQVNVAPPYPMREDSPFVDMMVDGNFKLILANPGNKPILIALLNEIIPKKIRDLSLMMQEHRGRNVNLKSSVFDLDCEFEDGRKAVIEVQFSPRANYLDRMLYYSTWPISEQIVRGERNYSLKEVFIISFCNFALSHDEDWDESKVISTYSIREDSNGEIMTNALQFIFIELGRFKTGEESLRDQLEHFLFYIKNLGHLKKEPGNIPFAEVENLVNAARVAGLSEDERTKYDNNMRNAFDIRTEKLMAREEAREEGLAEGRAEIAKSMKARDFDAQTISEITGLTLEQILAL